MSGDAGFPRWEIGGRWQWKSNICPRKLITPQTNSWLRLYSTYKAGFLLIAGGILNQPAIYIHAMTTIEALASEARKK